MQLILILFLFISIGASAQYKSFILNRNGDTLNRVDIKGKKQGPWSIHVDDLRGERGYEEEGYFENDQKTGTWKKYSLEGVKIAEESYSWGKLNGRSLYFTYNGGLLREENWRTIDPANAYDTVPVYDLKDMTKVVDWLVVKNEGLAMKHGKWIFYDPYDGRIEETQQYFMNRLQTENGVAADDEDLKPIGISKTYKPTTDSTGKKITQKPQAVLDYEKKNAGKKKIKVRDGSTGN